MAVVAPYGFETVSGKLADHLAGAAEGVGDLRRVGLQAVNLPAIAGTRAGVVATSVNHATIAPPSSTQVDEEADRGTTSAGQRPASPRTPPAAAPALR